MPELWTPGMAGPLDDLVARIHRRIKAFAAEHEQGLRELYVALTRPTTTLVVLYARPLPAELQLS